MNRYENESLVQTELSPLGVWLRDSQRPFFLVSNNTADTLTNFLRQHQLTPQLRSSKSAQDMAALKPDPSVMQDLLQQQKLEPEQTVFVGDSFSDLLVAKKTKIHYIYYHA